MSSPCHEPFANAVGRSLPTPSPRTAKTFSVLRIVCRNGFSHDLADLLLADLNAVVDHLNNDSRLGTATGPSGFRH